MMGSRTIFFCDVCGKDVGRHEITTMSVPVVECMVDEYGVEREYIVRTHKLAICHECADKVAMLKTNVGMAGPVLGENVYEWRTAKRSQKPGCQICSNCRYVIDSDWAYCPHCGKRFE